MKKNLGPSEVSPGEWFALNQFLHGLKKIDSACISVYYPYGRGRQTVSLLKETRRAESLEKIESGIEEKIAELREDPTSAGRFTKTLCIFGWIKDNRVIIRAVGTSKKLPYIYMASKKPYLKPFRDVLKINYDVLLVTLDSKTALMQKFHGSQITQEAKLRIDLQGRHKKGGQSQGRFLRARQTKIHVFFKKTAAKLREMGSSSEIILLGGAGHAKTEFLGELDPELAKKCHFVEGLTFSAPVAAIHKKIIRHLYQHRRRSVAQIIQKYEELVKEGLTAKRNDVIFRALQRGAVDTLIVSASYHTSSQFKKIIKMLEAAESTSSKIEFVTSPGIIKKLEIHDSVLAILRYKIR